MTRYHVDSSLEDSLNSLKRMRAIKEQDTAKLKQSTDLVRDWAITLHFQFHVPKARLARLAGVHRRTMEHWAKEAAAGELADIKQYPPV
jgi:hypothetical protein